MSEARKRADRKYLVVHRAEIYRRRREAALKRTPEQISARNAYNREWHKANRHKQREYDDKRTRKTGHWRAQYYRVTYGLTLEQYESLSSVCEICGASEGRKLKSGKIDRLVVDHCHATNKVCGKLCHVCNTGIGHFKHDVAQLEKAIEYLRRTRSA